MPLSRSYLLPKALTAFRAARPGVAVRVLEGTYDAMLGDLRRGEVDFLIGALRDPAPVADIVQERLFDDDLVLLAGPGHPAMGRELTPAQLARWPWLVPRAGTPTRVQFDAMFAAAGVEPPRSVIETGSILLMREMLRDATHLACVSRAQSGGEIGRGLVQVLDHRVPGGGRPIGLTSRTGWQPTPAQAAMLAAVRAAC